MNFSFKLIIEKLKRYPLFIAIGFFLFLLLVLAVISRGERAPVGPQPAQRPGLPKKEERLPGRKTYPPEGVGEEISPGRRFPEEEGAWPPVVAAPLSPAQAAKIAGEFVSSSFSISPSGVLVKRTCTKAEEGGSCSVANISGRIAGVVVDAFDELYKLTGEAKYQQKAFQVGEEIVKACQTDLESCKWGFYGLYNLYKKTGEQKYLNGMLAALPKLTNYQGINLYLASENTKKMIMLYQATGETSYLNTALNDYNTLINSSVRNEGENPLLYKTAQTQVRKFDCQKIWGTDLELYKATGEEKYLNNVKSFFENSQLSSNLSNIEELPQLTHCLDALVDLVERSGEERFKKEAVTIVRYIVENFWDSPESPKFSGDGGFVIFNTATKPEYKEHNLKCAAETSWMAKNFARLSRLGLSL